MNRIFVKTRFAHFKFTCFSLGIALMVWVIQHETTYYAIRPDSRQDYILENVEERMFLGTLIHAW
jgi:hypothetical protein